MNVDYTTLEDDLVNGSFRQRLEEELTFGFRQIRETGERLPVASHYAAQIAEIVNRDAELSAELKYNLYQEILAAVEAARAAVLGQVVAPN
ncbi:MAG TPA: hypothetical protein VE010_08545 [Thermoanaerobaculia bacterium]|nr:hypothetical protein [Thermoanaerobaculia bacterium]